ncbi:rhodanese-like domain-containing protein [Pontibacter toksunensis]|uniref:Rhodanese-like domain-containing protein n=1 Tax=Pontibacter toksunensis TaxID=1332631 RepID=A0ABW6BST5_9BACT
MITSSQDITAEELKERLNKGETPIIIDVREDWEYQEANIAGAKNIPLGTLPMRLDDIEDYKGQEVIVQCRSGARSANAKAFLQQQGFTNVRNLLGGILAYQG